MIKWTLCSGNKARLPCSGFPPHPHTQEHSPSSPLPPHPLSPLNIALELEVGRTDKGQFLRVGEVSIEYLVSPARSTTP